MAAAAAATPFAPPLVKLSTPNQFLNYRTRTPKLHTTSNPRVQRISCSKSSHKSRQFVSRAYISGPASDAIVSENDPKINDSDTVELQPIDVLSWGLLWKLVLRHKWRVVVSVLTLLGCTSCTLAMPIYSGRFFEVLIGARPEPIWQLLSKVGILYTLEPIFTIIFCNKYECHMGEGYVEHKSSNVSKGVDSEG